MKKTRVLVTLLCLWLGLVPLAAQSVKIINELELNPFASALALYKNEFGSFENHASDIPFPYAVIHMHLEGSGPAVREAKERLTLDVGQMFRVESRVTTYSNQIVFLVKAKRLYMLIDCGDGCEKVLLSNMQQLGSNCVYDCTVQFTPEGEQLTTDTVFVNQGPQYYELNLRVEPADATVEIVVNKERRIYTLENGQVSLQLLEGDYDYIISATGYYTENGTVHIPNNQTDTIVQLRSKKGKLSIVSDSTDLQGLSATISHNNINRIVSLPSKSFFCWPNTYTITIKKPGFQTYRREIVVDENSEICLAPKLIPKRKISSVKPIFAIDITDTDVLISGNLPERYVTETGLIYSTTANHAQGIKMILNAKGKFEKEISNLEPNTEYFVWAYACDAIDTIYSDVKNFRTLNYNPFKHGKRYVDLGLSVKCATCNLGAQCPEDYGDYFAWAEIDSKKTYDRKTYTNNDLSKYNKQDKLKILELEDDAATVNWGDSWRMPTDAELTELRTKCTWERTTQKGTYGYKVTSKSNGNSIFLPAAGYRYGSSLYYVDSYGFYWSSSLSKSKQSDAYVLFFSNNVGSYVYSRYYGLPIRPVCP